MTEDQAMQKMEGAISDLMRGNQTTGPQAVKVAAPGLDAGRLMELARDRLTFARERLLEIRRDHALKAFEIDVQYQRRLQDAQREHADAMASLNQQTDLACKPASDMVDLVERMLR